jgi:NAD(P)-dependent dehydrogenase (short-subunit alcohol dehydrogenase family)
LSQLLRDRVALVTGSTSGIGRAIAGRFAEHGAHVVVTGRRIARGEETVEAIRTAGGRASFFPADLESEEQTSGLARFIVESFGRLDILVNNAGLVPRRDDGSSLDGPIHQTDGSYWDSIYRVSLRSVFSLSKLCIPLLLESPHAVVIQIASALALRGYGVDVYSAIKGQFDSLNGGFLCASYSGELYLPWYSDRRKKPTLLASSSRDVSPSVPG